MKKKKLCIAGGGTGGHVFAALEIAELWPHKADVFFIGTQKGMEARKVPPKGFKLFFIQVGALNKVNFWQKIRSLCILPWSFLKVGLILLTQRPQFVLGVGGYASGPCVLMAALLRRCHLLACQTAIFEQNAVFGFTNRKLAPWADRIFLGFPATQIPPNAKTARTTFVGNPVRPFERTKKLAQKDPFTILVLGGSQGAIGLNTLIMDTQKQLLAQDAIQWLHQTGAKDFARCQQNNAPATQVLSFIESSQEMSALYNQADLVICRAGALTIAELAFFQKPAILVPLPTAADNHQLKNAQSLEQKEACVIFEQHLPSQSLATLIQEIRHSPERRKQLEQNIQLFYTPDTAQLIINTLSNHTNG